MSDPGGPGEAGGGSVAPAEAASTAPQARLLVPTLLFSCYLMAAAAGGALLLVGSRVLGLTAGFTAATDCAEVLALAAGAILGGTIAGRRVVRSEAPGAVLALLQAALGVSGILSVFLFRMARDGYLLLAPRVLGSDLAIFGLRTGLALALFFLPGALFCGMAPFLARLIVARRQGFGIACGFTFGLTLAGLGLGTAAGGRLFLPDLGIHGSLLVGVALAGIAASGTILMRQRGLEGPGVLGANLSGGELPSGEAPAGEEILIDEEVVRGATLASANMLVGFSTWTTLIAWSRTLTFLAGGTLEAEATIAAVFLISLATGAFIVGGLAERADRLPALLAMLLAGAALVGHASMYLVPSAATLFLRLTPLLDRPGLSFLPAALTAAVVMLPTCLLLGCALPLLPLAARARGRPMAGTIAFLALGVLFANLVSGLVVVPAFGLRRTVALAGAVGLLTAILFLGAVQFRKPPLRHTLTLVLLGLMIVLGGFPASWDPRLIAAGLYRYGARDLARFGSAAQYLAARSGVEVLFYREGRDATAIVERSLQPSGAGAPPVEHLVLTVDGKVEATTGDDIGAQVLQAHIPMLVHGPAERVLLIDFLSGVTAGSILRHPVRSLTILEREPALFEAAPVFADYNNRPLEDSRAGRIVDAARARLGIDPATYDVIIVASMDPWLAGSAGLATNEGFRLLRSRLRAGGLVAQRVQLSSTTGPAIEAMLRAFARAFDSILVFQTSPEDLLVLGSSEPLALDVARFKSVLGSSQSVARDLARIQPLGVNGLLMEFRLGGEALRGMLGRGPANDDDHAPVEVASFRRLRVHDNSAFLARLDGAWTGISPFLKNQGATSKDKAEFLYNLAKTYLGAAADPGKAREIAEELSGAGLLAKARWVRGECLIQAKDIDGALGEWQAVLDLEPDNLDALFSLGTYYLDSNDYRRAETFLRRAARLHPDTPVLLYTYGRDLYMLDRYSEAIAELKKVGALKGGKDLYPVIDYIIGASELQMGQDKDAAASLETYLKWAYTQSILTRLEVDAHLKLAQAYERQGKRFQAQQQRQKGDELLKRIQAAGLRPGGGPPPAGSPAAPSAAPPFPPPKTSP